MEKSLCKRENNERSKGCCAEANRCKDSKAEKLNQSGKSMQSLDFHKDGAVNFRDKGRMGYEKQGQKMEVTTIHVLISVISRIILVNLSSRKEPGEVGR